METSREAILSAPIRHRGNVFEDFSIGKTFDHHWGRTIDSADNTIFSAATLQINPLYFNQPYARAQGHDEVVVSPMLVFCTVFGLSVEDLSERGGAFLGIEELTFAKPVYARDTLTARSTVIALRESRSDPKYGIATWHTEGFNQDGERVVDFKRSNLVIRREFAE